MTIAASIATPHRAALGERYRQVRGQTEALCEPLETEDYVVSTMSDVSPTKWHLAHTSWFFETFVLAPFDDAYVSPNPRYSFLFNSYYVQAGERHCRAKRGIVTRPTVREVFEYRAHVDENMARLLRDVDSDPDHPAAALIELGLHHEQQHQELLLTDIKHVFWMNPLRPAYRARVDADVGNADAVVWHRVPTGVHRVGHDAAASAEFAFDNESPAHRVFLDGCEIASRVVTNGEYLEFIADGGYRRPELWLSNGWATVGERKWGAPLYWEREGDSWIEFTLAGNQSLRASDPVCHVSYFEADAFARWAGGRLPAEAEWEVAATTSAIEGTFVDARRMHPAPAPRRTSSLAQLYGDVWQWTQSPYVAYPGYAPSAGAVGEYNGKWMCDQWVLRGASCATPQSHARRTYRNFFPSDARWQFTGIRLARNA